jgi:predicted ATPase/tRNA A-37 threonylcarbamoyl transferase component Bud32
MTDSAASLSAALGDRYRLVREIGAGGMARVYLADDLRHQRRVAIKVLHPEFSAALGADRFLREITTTANLRHPHILPLYDSGAGGGTLFYVMPFVEGESLRVRLDRESQLPMEEALRIADEIADALHYAHGRGVVHRDIKPENILLENGRAVVADFGIAAAVNTAGGKLTQTGMTLGTPHYMSPEQAGGEAVDGRSDLYALGCLLYEMLAGTPPFTGPSAMAIMARHMIDPVPHITTLRPTVTTGVVAAIERALAKSPSDRFASIAHWREALRRPATAERAGLVAPPIHRAPPAPATPLLGREALIASAAEKLRGTTRVLTITGVGGTGKTRFAIEMFDRLRDGYPGGAAFVSLASVTAASEVMPAVATALEIAEAHGRSAVDAIATVIGDRRVLLLLDNLEQVVDAAEEIAALVARCPGLQVVATSRRPLKIGAESELVLPPLDLPATGVVAADELMQFASVALFVQRAVKVKPGFALSPANAESVAGICRSLDGLPLALELAAARVRILEPAALLLRLDHALDLLTSGDRDLPLRQRTLRATISWSYSLLSPGEQRLLRRLSVFHEGWTYDALEEVCYAEDDRFVALDELESLVEKGLVRVIDDGQRYSLLETIRAFAAEQLHAAGEVDPMRDAHADHFLEFSRGVDAGIQGNTQIDAMSRARSENANMFAALQWFVARARRGRADAVEKGMLMCGWLGWYWHIVGLHLVAHDAVAELLAKALDGPPTRGRAAASFTSGMVAANTGALQQAVEDWTRTAQDGGAIGDDLLHALGCCCTGYARLGMGDPVAAGFALDEALLYASRGGSDFLLALIQTIKGMQMFVTGELEGGYALIEQARRIQIRIGDFEGGGMAVSFLASMTFARGDLPGALARYREAEVTFGVVGDKPEIARVQCEAGYAALAGVDLPEARRSFLRALRTYDEVGSPRGTGQALIGLAATEAAAGNKERAVAIAAAAQEMSARAGVVVEHPMAPGVADRIETLKASVPKQELDGLLASGSAMTAAAVLAMVSA